MKISIHSVAVVLILPIFKCISLGASHQKVCLIESLVDSCSLYSSKFQRNPFLCFENFVISLETFLRQYEKKRIPLLQFVLHSLPLSMYSMALPRRKGSSGKVINFCFLRISNVIKERYLQNLNFEVWYTWQWQHSYIILLSNH